MPPWVIRCFCNARGEALFDEAYREQLPEARAKFRATLNGLKAQPGIEGWCRPNGFDRLSGKYRQLGKIRFQAVKVQHRPLGFFGPTSRTFTLLVWATERDGKFDPPNVREVALERMKLVINNPERSREFDF
jgi:hypothetical protein